MALRVGQVGPGEEGLGLRGDYPETGGPPWDLVWAPRGAVASRRLRPALNDRLRTGTDWGNLTV